MLLQDDIEVEIGSSTKKLHINETKTHCGFSLLELLLYGVHIFDRFVVSLE